MSPELPENRRECIARIRKAFDRCPRPVPELLAPDGGIDSPYVHRNWGHLTRDDVEALDFFGDSLAEDLTYMSSIAFRYYMPPVMILFLAHPERVDFGGFAYVVSRCEHAFFSETKRDKYCGHIAMSRAQAEAFRDWFGQLMTIIRKFRLGSFEEEYMERLRVLRSRARTSIPKVDHDHETILSAQTAKTRKPDGRDRRR